MILVSLLMVQPVVDFFCLRCYQINNYELILTHHHPQFPTHKYLNPVTCQTHQNVVSLGTNVTLVEHVKTQDCSEHKVPLQANLRNIILVDLSDTVSLKMETEEKILVRRPEI